MNGVRVLLVSGDGGVARSWEHGLSDTGADVRIVKDSAAALQHLDLLRPDVILIDLRLPGALNGFDTCRAVRSHTDAIIVLAAAEGETFDEIVALAVGADHFFAADEPERLVIARVQSLVRRAHGLVRVAAGVGVEAGVGAGAGVGVGPGAGLGPGASHAATASGSSSTSASSATCTGGPDCSRGRSLGRLTGRFSSRTPTHSTSARSTTAGNGQVATWTQSPLVGDGHDDHSQRIVVGDLEIDVDAREVWVTGVPVVLTRIEFDLLVTLAEQPRRVFTREQLMERAWGDTFDGSHVLDTHLSRLRCKVTSAGGECVAHAVRGVGYRLRGHHRDGRGPLGRGRGTGAGGVAA